MGVFFSCLVVVGMVIGLSQEYYYEPGDDTRFSGYGAFLEGLGVVSRSILRLGDFMRITGSVRSGLRMRKGGY